MPKFAANDKVTVENSSDIADIVAIAVPASATAEDCANKINEILAALKEKLV